MVIHAWISTYAGIGIIDLLFPRIMVGKVFNGDDLS
jgi:hypothetical protein